MIAALSFPPVLSPCRNTVKVPAMRMALDFIVYLRVVVLFNSIIAEGKIDTVTPIELFFTSYITVRLIFCLSSVR